MATKNFDISAHSENIQLLIAAIATLKSKGFTADDTWNKERIDLALAGSRQQYLHVYTANDGSEIRVEIHPHNCGATNTFSFPAEFSEFIAECERLKAEFEAAPVSEIGAWVTVLEKGYKTTYAKGLKPGNTFQVTEIENSIMNASGKWLISASGNYVCASLVRPATPEEIESTITVTIDGYESAIDKSAKTVAFGCQKFTKRELEIIRRLVLTPTLDAKLTIRGVKITPEMVDTLLSQI